MHLRITTVRRGSTTYRYPQLVESYRRERDGKPAVRVVASLPPMDEDAVAQLQIALAAYRARGAAGPAAVPAERPVAPTERARVVSNLAYLDAALLLHLWDDLGLAALLRRAIPSSGSEVPVERVIAALAIHRCIAPGSKLAAERWFSTTALPELLGVEPGQFNNVRLHRALEALESAEGQVQDGIASLVAQKEGAFACLFVDATDTWFVGDGPPMASRAKDKEGIYRQRVGLVLLCDQDGHPLRWEVLAGRFHDPAALLAMFKQAVALPWVGELPLVMDRAVGKANDVAQLAASSARYLTGLPYGEFASSGAPVPWAELAALQAECAREGADPESVDRAAVAAGFVRARPDRYVRDLGVFDKARPRNTTPSLASAVLQVLDRFLQNPEMQNHELVASTGHCTRTLRRYRALCALDPAVVQRIRSGEADGLNLAQLLALARLPGDAQAQALDATLSAAKPGKRVIARKNSHAVLPPPLRTRGVLYFNPVQFGRASAAEAESMARLEATATKINARLASPRSGRKDASILGEIGSQLRRFKLGDVVTARIDSQAGVRRLVLDQNAAAWERRRRHYGVMLFVGHPDLPGTAGEIVALYFSKDAIEKDFQAIKSVIELRPVRHRTDHKVRAHVAICALALLLERTLARRLRTAKAELSSTAALELLKTVHLNQVKHGKQAFYTVTAVTNEQRRLLEALGLESLARDKDVAKTITPR